MSPQESEHKGTFEGIREKIPYLVELGVNAVELMPILNLMKWKMSENMRAESCSTTGDIIRFVFLRPIPVMRLHWNLTEKVMSCVIWFGNYTEME